MYIYNIIYQLLIKLCTANINFFLFKFIGIAFKTNHKIIVIYSVVKHFHFFIPVKYTICYYQYSLNSPKPIKYFFTLNKIKLKKYGQVSTTMLYSKYRVTQQVTIRYFLKLNPTIYYNCIRNTILSENGLSTQITNY